MAKKPMQAKAQPKLVECTYCENEVSFGRLFSCDCKHIMCINCSEIWRKKKIPEGELVCPLCRQKEATEHGKGLLHFGSILCQECEQLKNAEEIVWCKLCPLLLCFKCDHPSSKKHGLKGHAVEPWNSLSPVKDSLGVLTKATAEAKNTKKDNSKVLAKTWVQVELGIRERLSSNFEGLQDALLTLRESYECISSVVEESTPNVAVYLRTAETALHLAKVNTAPLELKPPPVMYTPSKKDIQHLVEVFCKILTREPEKASLVSSDSIENNPNAPTSQFRTCQTPDDRASLSSLQVSRSPEWTVNTQVADTHYQKCVYYENPLVLLSEDNKALSVELCAGGKSTVEQEGHLEINSDTLQIVGVQITGSAENWVLMPVAYKKDEIIVKIPKSAQAFGFDDGIRSIKTKEQISDCHTGSFDHFSNFSIVAANHGTGCSTICLINPKNKNGDVQEVFNGRISAVAELYGNQFCFFDQSNHSIVIRSFDRMSKDSITIATINTEPCSHVERIIYGWWNDTAHIVGKGGEFVVTVSYSYTNKEAKTLRVGIVPEEFKNAGLVCVRDNTFHLAQKNDQELHFHQLDLP